MNLSLKGRTAVVCGSTQGIGLATAQQLAALGATCILVARNEDSLREKIKTLDTAEGQAHRYVVADFSHPDDLKKIAEAELAHQPVHILVNNTGGPPAGPMLEAKEEDFMETFNRHVIASHILSKIVVPSMKKEGYGRIINVISTSVKIPLKNLGVSNTIRGAMGSWAKTMANELGSFNITVNNVLPGFTNTNRLKLLIENIASRQHAEQSQVIEEMVAEVPMKRFAEAEEIAAVAAFLATPAASYVNGVSIPVDGGRTGSI